jgi:hypothetical protein
MGASGISKRCSVCEVARSQALLRAQSPWSCRRGLIRPGFVSSRETRDVRELTRHRVTEDRNRIHNRFSQMISGITDTNMIFSTRLVVTSPASAEPQRSGTRRTSTGRLDSIVESSKLAQGQATAVSGCFLIAPGVVSADNGFRFRTRAGIVLDSRRRVGAGCQRLEDRTEHSGRHPLPE